jgi:hypothetical protein
MNAPHAEESPKTPRSRTRFEVIFASAWLAFGLFVLPGLIFAVGTALLGPYGEDRGVGTFYADFFGDLATLNGRTWCLALGPLVLITVLRLVFLNFRSAPKAGGASKAPPAPTTVSSRLQGARRVEPRVSLD